MKYASVINSHELNQLCASVRVLVIEGNYEAGKEAACRAMERYPHAPQPHNLLGIILEKTGKHADAMKHFRAANALDPSYLPAKHNLFTYGTFYSSGRCAYDESDVSATLADSKEHQREGRGIGHAIRR